MATVLRLIRVLALVVIVLGLISFAGRIIPAIGQPVEINYSTFLDDVKANRVDSVVFQGDLLYARLRDKQIVTKIHNRETEDSALIGVLQQAGVSIEHEPPRRPVPMLAGLLGLLAPLLVVIFARPRARSVAS